MKLEIIEQDKKLGILRITTLDERFYARTIKDNPDGISEYKFYPSSSWISGYYYKSPQLIKWIASNGYDESEVLKKVAGKKGTVTHKACEDLSTGKEVKIDSEYTTTGKAEEITFEEYTNVKSFADWISITKPEILAIEKMAFNEKYQYAGTVDYIMRIDGQIWIVDLKTSKSIWPSAELQISSYSHLDLGVKKLGITDEEWKQRKLAILQVGYARNKFKKYKFTEIKDKFDVFLNTKAIWANENKDVSPKQIEYPLSLQLELDNTQIVGLKVKQHKLSKETNK